MSWPWKFTGAFIVMCNYFLLVADASHGPKNCNSGTFSNALWPIGLLNFYYALFFRKLNDMRKIAKHHHFSDKGSIMGRKIGACNPDSSTARKLLCALISTTFNLVTLLKKLYVLIFRMLDVIYGRPLVTCTHFRKLDLIYAAKKLLDVIYGLVNSRTEC